LFYKQERKSDGQSSEDGETEQSAPAGGQPVDMAKVLAALNALHAQINNLSQIEKVSFHINIIIDSYFRSGE
jgi:hypothetical protein